MTTTINPARLWVSLYDDNWYSQPRSNDQYSEYRLYDFDYLAESARTASGHFHGHLVALSEIEEAFKEFIAANAKMDRIKKLLFYGEDAAKGRVASIRALEGLDDDANMALYDLATAKEVSLGSQNAEYLLHATLGTATEAGEMVEHLYDVIFNGKPLDMVNLTEEVFDGQWYHAMFCRVAGITFDQGQRQNIEKLRKRFPDKFTTAAANERDLNAERAVLELNGMYPDAVVKSTKIESERFNEAWIAHEAAVQEREAAEMEDVVRLVAPDGWFLHRAAHEHTGIVYRGDVHQPLPHAAGAWVVEFQRYPNGGYLTRGRGKNLCEAWVDAVSAVAAVEARSLLAGIRQAD